MKTTIIILIAILLCSCSQGLVVYNLKLNVKEYDKNELVSCRSEKVKITQNKAFLNVLDLKLVKVDTKEYKDQNGTKYTVSQEVNNAGYILMAVGRDSKSYIVSTSGKCQ